MERYYRRGLNRNYFIGSVALISGILFSHINMKKYSKWGLFILIEVGLLIFAFGDKVQSEYWWRISDYIALNTTYFPVLYVPIFASLLPRYKQSNFRGIIKLCFWMILPVALLLTISVRVPAALMLVSMLIIFTFAIINNDWYRVSKPLTIATLWILFAVAPLCIVNVLQMRGYYGFTQRFWLIDFLSSGQERSVRQIISYQ